MVKQQINKAYIPTIIVLCAVALFHYCGIHFNLYIMFPWYDIGMHILGGAGIALLMYWLGASFFPNAFNKKTLWCIVLITFLIGIGWEMWEAYYDIAGNPVGSLAYWLDTIKDLLDDLLGALFVYISIK